ncbi:oligosaccharide flippase family protein [Idiomarina abyssalis]|uniref:oligosaccharide flippase family protein n=1 Tax=Idiomarina abyssalis TaxID=86102 RepID=UPI003A8F017D
MSIKKYVKAISILWASSMVGAGVTFLIQVLVARRLGVESFGDFSSALAVVTIVSPLAGFGIQGFWLRIFGEEGPTALRWVGSSLRFSLLTTLTVFVFLLSWAILSHSEEKIFDLLKLLLSLHLFSIVLVELVSGCLQIEGRYGVLAMWQLAPHLMRFVLIATMLLFFSADILTIGYIYAVVSLLLLTIGIGVLRRMLSGDLQLAAKVDQQVKILPPGNDVSILNVFKGAWPFGAAAAFYLIYFQIAVVLLRELSGPASAGIYNVAFLILSAFYLFPSVVYQKFLVPKVFHWSNHDKRRMRETYRIGMRFMLALGLLAMVGIWIGSPYMVPLVFGDHYKSSVPVLQILALAAPMRFLSSTFSSVLTTQHLMKLKVVVMFIGAVLAIAVGVVAITLFGVVGAASTTVFVELFLLGSFYCIVKKFVFRTKLRI